MFNHVCIVGLGHIGLPLACVLAHFGISVIGVDVDEERVKKIALADIEDHEPGLSRILTSAIDRGLLVPRTAPLPADVFIIAVPTPLTSNKEADLSHVFNAADSILPFLKPSSLVLIESTCPIGTTEKIARRLNHHSCIAYCPERVLPGNIIDELIHNDRIVGGINPSSTSLAKSFYKSFIQAEVVGTDDRHAEAAKLAENTYRDINIAFANELSMIAEQNELDVNLWIDLSNKHPRVNILKPGPGVGGHCLSVDPWFLVSAAPQLAQLTAKAREINDQKSQWVIDQIRSAIKKTGAKSIACLGLTYKPNAHDIRESKALLVAQTLINEVKVFCVDPYLSSTHSAQEAIDQSEIIIGLVAHSSFDKIPKKALEGKTVLDFGEVFS